MKKEKKGMQKQEGKGIRTFALTTEEEKEDGKEKRRKPQKQYKSMKELQENIKVSFVTRNGATHLSFLLRMEENKRKIGAKRQKRSHFLFISRFLSFLYLVTFFRQKLGEGGLRKRTKKAFFQNLLSLFLPPFPFIHWVGMRLLA